MSVTFEISCSSSKYEVSSMLSSCNENSIVNGIYDKKSTCLSGFECRNRYIGNRKVLYIESVIINNKLYVSNNI